MKRILWPDTIIVDTFKVMKEFVYLGSVQTAYNDVNREIQRRSIVYYGLQKKL